MQAVRPPTWGDIQGAVDGIYDARAFGEERSVSVDVPVGAGREDFDGVSLAAALRASAARLVEPLAGRGLPAGFAEQVREDAEDIGVAVASLLPAADRLSLKLELMSHACLRWHQDNYVARAIVSYNCCGTEYIHHDHDFWELNNCGNNDCVVRDRAQVLQAGVGDMCGCAAAHDPPKRQRGAAALHRGAFDPRPGNAAVRSCSAVRDDKLCTVPRWRAVSEGVVWESLVRRKVHGARLPRRRGGGFLVKGKLFPGVATGLVHRSPDPVYHADGVTAKTRLVLKVDVYGPPDAYVLQIAR
ncbi:unnamed protein product [Prorocentrum cordatum]|uniref:Uncharacterized protein n=1 Tax=Prorocentrum cordatum TaxID=2364126 RepID=A0ABN9VSM4_9DINO|nr:unnamed protein product [Polarella glacialis]